MLWSFVSESDAVPESPSGLEYSSCVAAIAGATSGLLIAFSPRATLDRKVTRNQQDSDAQTSLHKYPLFWNKKRADTHCLRGLAIGAAVKQTHSQFKSDGVVRQSADRQVL